MAQYELESAFVLHRRPFRDTSLIVEFFTEGRGRISCVARGAKRPKSPWRGILHGFTPLLISFYGRNELMTLKTAEPKDCPLLLKNKCFMSGFYLNELLMRLLQKEDAHPNLFSHYVESLQYLAADDDSKIESILRNFELNLLDELGYGLQLDYTVAHEAISPDKYYLFTHQQGLIEREALPGNSKSFIFHGKSLLNINRRDFSQKQTLRDAKRLLRYEISELLGDKPLNSRQLFI